ncbi:2Fe-2S iron-sulfur cluster-binding protein [Bacillus songklensis]|uniref:2Fe-2S iron-sulfur cluster-binding protein n=1 Tax=Bacillus songklensis TaxID=1069116 RepID=A0ABV8B3J9_9BACI
MERKLTVGSLIQGKYSIEVGDLIIEPEKNPIKTFIEIKQNNQSFKLTPAPNELLLDSALKQNIPLDYKCRKGTCGRCAVEILEGHNLLHPPNEIELKKCRDANFRLACQAKIK